MNLQKYLDKQMFTGDLTAHFKERNHRKAEVSEKSVRLAVEFWVVDL